MSTKLQRLTVDANNGTTTTDMISYPLTGTDLTVAPVSWTPVDSSGAGLSITVVADGCIAYKIGQLVFCFIDIAYPVTVNAAAAKIGGLPYTSKTTTNAIGSGAAGQNGAVAALAFSVNTNSTTVQFFVALVAQPNVTLSGSAIRGCFIYTAAS